MNMPKVSVIMPVYNVQQYLKQAIDSICNQTYSNWELILVDDGSTDESPQICDAYEKINEKIHVIHQKNTGLSGARNAGIGIAGGKYLIFVDSDDYIDLNTLAVATRKAEEQQADCVIYETVGFYEENQKKFPYTNRFENPIYTGKQAGEVLLNMMVSHEYQPMACGYLLRTDILHEHGINFYEGILHEDELFTLQVMLLCKKITFLYMPCYYYRLREGSIMRNHKNQAERGNSLLIIIQELTKLYARYENDILRTEVLDMRLEHLFQRAVAAYMQGTYHVRKRMKKNMRACIRIVQNLERPWSQKEEVTIVCKKYQLIALKYSIKEKVVKQEAN